MSNGVNRIASIRFSCETSLRDLNRFCLTGQQTATDDENIIVYA